MCIPCNRTRAQYGTWKTKSNLVAHLQARHEAEYDAALEYFNSQKKEIGAVKQERSSVRVQNNLRAKVTPELKRLADVHLAITVVQESWSLNVGESAYLRDWIDSFHGVGHKQYVPATTKTIVKYIACWEAVTKHQLKVGFQAAVETSLPGFRPLSLQYDLWEDGKKESVAGVTITSLNLSSGFESSCLVLKPLEGSHTGEAVAGAIRDAAAECIIPIPTSCESDKEYMSHVVDAATADGGSDAKKSSSLLGCTRIHCSSHRLNLAVKDSMRVSADAEFFQSLSEDLLSISTMTMPNRMTTRPSLTRILITFSILLRYERIA